MLSDLLRCPDCHGALAPDGDRVACTSCRAEYLVTDGIADLVGERSVLNESEVETQDRVSTAYENLRYGRSYSRRYHDHTIERLTRLVPPRGVVLDNGCGTGIFLEQRQGLPATRSVGIDISRGMLGHARARLPSDVELVRADACRLPFAADTFDVIFARSLLHHLPDPAAGAAEMARTLKPGGALVVLDTHRTIVSDLPRRLANRGDHFDEDHKNFRVAELTQILGACLRVARIEFIGYVAYPLLGFPDLIDFGRMLPLERLAPLLIALDDRLARLPVVQRLGWGVMLRAEKP
jgi:SAM-dependent methyltransferase